ncbi:ATP-binding protein [Luteibacter sp. PPL552]
MRATRFSEIQDWMRSLELLKQDGRCPTPGFFKPFHFVTMALVLKELGAGSLNLPDDIVTYAARMKLWEALGLPSPVTVQPNPGSTRFHELTPLVDLNSVENTAEALLGIVSNNVGRPCDEDSLQSLYVMLTELLGNCHHHARSADNLHGLTCAQSWWKGERAQFAIADSGIGIRRSLSENADLIKRLAGSNSCELALRLGISSKLNKGHAGYGLAVAKGLTDQSRDSRLFVHSYDEAVVVQDGKVTEVSKVHNGFSGTLVVFEWNTRVPLNVTSVYDSWPKPEDESDDYL